MARHYKIYPSYKITPEAIQHAFNAFKKLSEDDDASDPISTIYRIDHLDKALFFSSLEQGIEGAEMFVRLKNGAAFSVKYEAGHTEVKVTHPEDIKLDVVKEILDKAFANRQ